jgi:hypothetical protein
MVEKKEKKELDWARREARRVLLKVIEAYREYTGREP